MKSALTVAALCLATLLSAQAVQPLSSRSVLKLSPQHLLVATMQLGVERFNKDFSRSWNMALGIRSQGHDYLSSFKIRGAEIDVQYRKYMRPVQSYTSRKNRNYVQGIYVGPFANGGFFSVDTETTRTFVHQATGATFFSGHGNRHESLQFAGGLTIGVQRLFWDVILVDVFAGGGLRHASINMVSNRFGSQLDEYILDPGFSGVFPRIGFTIGIPL